MRCWSRWLIAVLLLSTVSTLLAACGGRDGDNGKPVALASFYPLYFLTAALAGDRMEVRNMVPAGAEPHDWEPSTREMANLKKAKIFVYNGAAFEAWVPKTRDAARAKDRVDVEATAGLPLAPPPPGEEAAQFPADPHVWLDPVLAQEMAARIAEGLIRADPAGRETYERNLVALRARLDDLDRGFKSGLSGCARKEIVTAHAAFGYLARRYGLEQIPIEGLSPDAEPTPARIAEVSRIARARGATHVFFETLVSPRVAETIAREIGAQTLVLDPLEGVAEGQGRDYFTVMNDNLANLRTGLGCRR